MKPVSTIPVFHVSDIDASVRFYTTVLGFAQSFRYGTYVSLRLKDVTCAAAEEGFHPRRFALNDKHQASDLRADRIWHDAARSRR